MAFEASLGLESCGANLKIVCPQCMSQLTQLTLYECMQVQTFSRQRIAICHIFALSSKAVATDPDVSELHTVMALVPIVIQMHIAKMALLPFPWAD